MSEFTLFVIFALVSAADGVLTHGLLSRGGFEASPLIAFAYAKAGVYGLGAVKIAIVGLVGYWQINGILPNWGMLLCIGLYSLAVLHLLRERRKQLVRAQSSEGAD